MWFEDYQYVNPDDHPGRMHRHYSTRVKWMESHVSASILTIAVNHLEDEQEKLQPYEFHELPLHFVILVLRGMKHLHTQLLYRHV
jgi:hypothetical protein